MEKYGEEIFQLISAYVSELTADIDHAPIEKDSMLSPLGLDSIGRALIIEKMIETLNLSGPRYEFYQANNLGELAEVFARKVKENHTTVGISDSPAQFHVPDQVSYREQAI
jgi:polyketide biosynthesis acyl carrier protein